MSTAGQPTLHIEHARRWGQRLVGLMFRPKLAAGHGLLLTPCTSVHTAFMRFAIDVVYLDTHCQVLAVHPELRPWRMSWGPRGTRHTLELPAGTAKALGWQCGQSVQSAIVRPKDEQQAATARN